MKHQIPFIHLNADNDKTPLYRKIYEAIRTAILSGEFASGVRLPATRDLAKQLGVSRLTVVNAYEQLFAEGYLEGKTGSGTFVAKELPENLLQINNLHNKTLTKSAFVEDLRLSSFGKKLDSSKAIRERSQALFVPFQNGLTAVDEFPFEIWSKIASRIIRNPTKKLLGYGDPQGFAPLRAAIAEHLKSARGVICNAEQVIITSGAQQALDLTARIFLETGSAVVVEDPCYLEARNAFAATGAKIIPVEVGEDGLDAAKFPPEKNIEVVYVTPSHQYPLGVTMSLSRRLALIDWAKTNNSRIIEDDYNSEFRYAGRPLASLQGLDKEGRVLYIGTFSKTIFPSLRIGCIVVPPNLVDVFANARALNDVHSSIIEQAILSEFIAEGHFSRHIRRMRTLYQERQNILLDECKKHLKGLLEIKKADAGMHLVGWLPENVSDLEVYKKGIERGLKLSPVSLYSVNPQKRGGIIFGYTAFNRKEIAEGIKVTAEIIMGILSNQNE
jgi:GntR family transcriptional regulator / MocR family aminotransferase